MTRAAIPASKEPTGLVRSDGKRPDGLSLIPWREGRCLVWDVTVADTTAASYLHSTSVTASSAAESAARRKETKYTELSHRYEFVPIAMETHGPLDTKAVSFLSRSTHYNRHVRHAGNKPLVSETFSGSTAVQRCMRVRHFRA
jgi:hypothetical protein